MKIGAKILDTIDQAIRLRDKVLLVLSETSISSEWVEDEVTKAFAEERRRGGITVLFPIRLDDALFGTNEAWALKLRDNRNIGDFRRWKGTMRVYPISRRIALTPARYWESLKTFRPYPPVPPTAPAEPGRHHGAG